ncbi:hypothetical protein LOK49_LG08G03267 [Camellia lanceoleosa]|uniref:Uncharacterized protein n=1 Tax=Camellia lanceoleosa TaxID=1840588 RepID=A0ACC0GNV7_9ERIC|nr:hypothetical protein LOK49_LG08G03267 [Camellia lanceoleosa]
MASKTSHPSPTTTRPELASPNNSTKGRRVRGRVRLRGLGRTYTEESGRGHGGNGRLRFATHRRESESGSEPTTPLRKPP